MNKRRSLFLLTILMLVIVLISADVALAQDDDEKVRLTIVNNSNANVTVRLDGPEDYDITVRTGQSKTRTIVAGNYDYRYGSCGVTWDGTLEADENVELVIYDCQYVPTKMQIKSHLSEDVEVSLAGFKNYKYAIDLGKNRVELLSGDYTFSWEACGNSFSETMFVTKAGTSEITLHSCEWYDSPARIYGKPNPVKFAVYNTASFPVEIYLVGPYSYLFNIQPGKNRIIVTSGTYEYGYFLDGTWNTGTATVLQNGTSELVLTPSYIFEIE